MWNYVDLLSVNPDTEILESTFEMDVHQVSLTFKNSGSVTVPMTVRKISHGMKHTH